MFNIQSQHSVECDPGKYLQIGEWKTLDVKVRPIKSVEKREAVYTSSSSDSEITLDLPDKQL